VLCSLSLHDALPIWSSWTVATVGPKDRRVASLGSAMAATSTSAEPPSARRWLRPIRPAPARPNLNADKRSEPPRGQVLTVRALVRRRRPVWVRQHVLLDHDPSRVGVSDRLQDRVDVEISFTQ